MKQILFLALTFLSLNTMASDYFEDFKNHPDFKKRLEVLLADDIPTGKPQVTEMYVFGEGYDLWKKYIVIQKLKSPMKKALVMKVETQGISLDCELGADDQELGELIKKHCGWLDKFVELTSSVNVIEIE
ncbi:MAG: hypothetical protein EP326_07930 [Deltaproteobacteria bacterium]|nr:MAG: hypothetical protein EP326_07930 [Deltaproteobacteria bacterium]TNF27507.1 MAG: hypothetical protein EP319_11310 [Deltaproteobacteria bacterium]